MNDARREKLRKQLAAQEAEYRVLLLDALESCAGGSWGLFGQNDHTEAARYENSDALDLLALGAAIEALRNRLGLFEPFALHARLQMERGRKGANKPGEPKLAQAWLAEMEG
jgi:hypothetical protein